MNNKHMNTFAVIDLGTNTFHLLIVEDNGDGSFRELYRKQHFVKLAEEGIQTIGAAAFARGLDVMESFNITLDEYKVNQLTAFGTAALRTASNGQDFVNQVKEKNGIEIELISGDREAVLIHKGVLQAVPFTSERMLIMDIGGGSVEFIIADKNQVYWAQSFPIGVAVLYKNFHQNNPITNTEIQATQAFCENNCSRLKPPLPPTLPTHSSARLAHLMFWKIFW